MYWVKRRILSSPFAYQHQIALQIPHLWPPAVQIPLALWHKTLFHQVPFFFFDHLPLKTTGIDQPVAAQNLYLVLLFTEN